MKVFLMSLNAGIHGQHFRQQTIVKKLQKNCIAIEMNFVMNSFKKMTINNKKFYII
jgi:aminoglycoside N3'-acetyltransferase